MRMLRLTALLALSLATSALVLAAKLETAQGTVGQLTRVDTLGAEAEPLLLMQLVDGRVFAFPGIEHLPAGGGVEVEIDYLPVEDLGQVPEACAARLLGVPITVDGEERVQAARRPVPIFTSSSDACP